LRHDTIHDRINDQANQRLHLEQRLNDVVARQRSVEFQQFNMSNLLGLESAQFGIPIWYDSNLCEPAVQLAIRDLVRPGDIVFDVGANAGALSVLMSRLVGLRGAVCSFEASRRIVDKTQHNLIANGCSNTQLYHRAVYDSSGKTVVLYHGSHLNDSIEEANDSGLGTSEVESIALDDFVNWSGFQPSLIKIDIEGAEYDALQGAAKLIADVRPTFLLEHLHQDKRCWELLRGAGYRAIDLATYRPIDRLKDLSRVAAIANLLYIHGTKIEATPYRPPFERECTEEIEATSFRTAVDGSREVEFSAPRPGRYLLDFDFTANGCDNEVMMGVEAGATALVRYHAYSSLLAASYLQMPFQVKRAGPLNIYFRFRNGTTDPTLRFHKVAISRIVNFDSVSPPLVD
jgi:FkbM family methyltransferase